MNAQVREFYSMDYTTKNQVATNDGLTFFKRTQYKDYRYGYKWSKWKPTIKDFFDDAVIDCQIKVRLPKQ